MTRQEYNRKILGLEKRIRFLEGINKAKGVTIQELFKNVEQLKKEIATNEGDKDITSEELGDGSIKLTDAVGPVQLRNIPTKGKVSPSGDTKEATPSLLKRARKSLLRDS